MLSLLIIVICNIQLSSSSVEVIAGDNVNEVLDGVGTNARFHTGEVLALSRDDSFALVGDRGTGIRSIDMTTKEVTTIYSYSETTTALGISNDGTFAVYSTPDYWVYKLDLATNSVVDEQLGYNKATDIAFGPDDSYILSFTEDKGYITKIDFDADGIDVWAGHTSAKNYVDGVGTNALFVRPTTGAFNSDFSILYVIDHTRVRELIVSTMTVTTLNTIETIVPYFSQVLPGDTAIIAKASFTTAFSKYDISADKETEFSLPNGASFGGGCSSDGSYCLFVYFAQVIKYSLPTSAPTGIPTFVPSAPSSVPTGYPSGIPTFVPSAPSSLPTGYPSGIPTRAPSSLPTGYPSGIPTRAPSSAPTGYPSGIPTRAPSSLPTGYPSCIPTFVPSAPSSLPTGYPSGTPSHAPSSVPTGYPSGIPTTVPSLIPSSVPSLPISAGGKQYSNKDKSTEELSFTVVVLVALGGVGIVAGTALVLYLKFFSYTKVNPTPYVVEP